MRHIDTAALQDALPPKWERRAQRALTYIRGLSPADRAKAINRRAHLWQQLSEIFGQLSQGKCWYCESREKRSDTPLDHFRPKNKVIESPSHEGYWWLAFDWGNYRFSCTYCNSYRLDENEGDGGGKHDHFPLVNEVQRAYTELDDLDNEEPEMLDPTNAADPTLLWFTEDGRAVEKHDEESYPFLYQRAKTSIKLYHLNHVLSRDARKALFLEIQELIKDGDLYFRSWQGGNFAARHGCNRVVIQLRQKLDRSAEYSAAARAMLLGFRDSDHPWVDGLLSAA